MSLPSLLQISLSSLLDSPAVVELAARAGDKAVMILKNHFTLSSKEINEAIQNSYAYALSAIAAGLAAPKQKLAFIQKLRHSKFEREFYDKIETNYLQPFLNSAGFQPGADSSEQGDISAEFRTNAIENCRVLIPYKKQLFQDAAASALTEADFAAIMSYKGPISITDLVIKQLETFSPSEKCDDWEYFVAFLRYKDLLGNAILFFFQEQLRQHPRVKDTFAALQRAGLWVDVRDLKTAQQSLMATLEQQHVELLRQLDEQKQQMAAAMEANDFARLTEIGQVSHGLQQQATAIETELKQVSEILQRAHAAWQHSYEQLLQLSADFNVWAGLVTEKVEVVLGWLDELMPLVKGMDQKLDLILAGMAQLGLSPLVSVHHEFTHYDEARLRQLEEEVARLKQSLTKNSPYRSHLAIIEGSIFSSRGDLEQAKQKFLRALECAPSDQKRALAHFNLFQVYLRGKDYANALAALQEAYSIDVWQYALHDVDKYPLVRILGAGGMGCVFLCQDQWRKKHVVVKTFWEGRKGRRDEVFREPIIMHNLDSAYIPKPLDCGFVNAGLKERPYFVTEYIEDVIDGETWLKQHGRLDLLTGLDVALQIAEALAVAHDAGVLHLDLKPANLLFKSVEDGLVVKIIDFGLARVATSLKQQAALTQTRSHKTQFAQAVFGTLGYAPPEQLGEMEYGQPTVKSDVYAFGATVYHLLSGENPRFPHPDELPDVLELQRLLLACFKKPVEKRPTIQTVITRLSGLLDKLDKTRLEKRTQPRLSSSQEDSKNKSLFDRMLGGAKHALRGVSGDGDAAMARQKVEAETKRAREDIEIARQMATAEKTRADDAGMALQKAKDEKVRARKEAETARQKAQQEKTRADDAEMVLQEVEDEARRAREEIETARQMAAAEKSRADDAEMALRKLEAETRRAREEIETARQMAAAEKTRADDAELALRKLEAETRRAREEIKTARQMVAAEKSRADDAEMVLQKAKDETKRAREEIKTARQMVAAEKSRADDAEMALQKAKDEKVRARKEAETARQKAQQEKTRADDAEMVLQEVEAEKNRVHKEIEMTRQKAEAEKKRAREVEIARQKAEDDKKGKLFSFKFPIIDANGKTIRYESGQAHYQIENLGNGVVLEMVYIEGGTFLMGSPETEEYRDDDETQHEVTVKPFYLGKYPITQAQWQAVMGNNPSYFKGENRPVERVSWFDVVKFCQRLSEITGKDYRLPSEAEWECGCRGGSVTARYWGDASTTELANYDMSVGETTEVGKYPPNAFGLYDMLGNVWEWTGSPFEENYQGKELVSLMSQGGVGRFAARGASWGSGARWARSANRIRVSPTSRNDWRGVRLVRML
jgi:formylglycine-generating enzyme required for sulfatase activity/serine/threonine protein kinase